MSGDLIFVFVGDREILKINREFLKHNYYTDVIAFDYCSSNIIEGEIYLSIDTIRKNALSYSFYLREEVLRVMIHSILHLIGYNDSDEEQQSAMRRAEDRYLEVFKEMQNGF